MHLKHADNGIKQEERMNTMQMKNKIIPTQKNMPTRARAWNAIMQSKWVQETIDNRDARLYKKTWSPTRLGHQLSEYEKKGTINPQEFGTLLFDQTRLTQVCADSGCMITIYIPGTPMKNVRSTRKPIQLRNASGGWLETTHEGEIDIPGLPAAARKAHICPKLAHTSADPTVTEPKGSHE